MTASPQTGKDILELSGEVDLHRSQEIRAAIAPLIARKVPRLLIDMTKVSYIDSSGLALFIETLQRLQHHGGTLALFGLRENVRAIFHMACLDQVFRIFPDKAAATAS